MIHAQLLKSLAPTIPGPLASFVFHLFWKLAKYPNIQNNLQQNGKASSTIQPTATNFNLLQSHVPFRLRYYSGSPGPIYFFEQGTACFCPNHVSLTKSAWCINVVFWHLSKTFYITNQRLLLVKLEALTEFPLLCIYVSAFIRGCSLKIEVGYKLSPQL